MINKLYETIKKLLKENIIFIILLTLIIAVTYIKLPYVVEMPGGTIDLTDRVKLNGENTKLSGTFNMAYVSMVDGNVMFVVSSLINKDWELIPLSDYTYNNEPIEDTTARDKIYLEQSKNSATVAAFNAAGIEYKVVENNNYVIYLSEQAQTDLKIGDRITKINDKTVEKTEDISNVIQASKPGDKVKFTVLRDKKEENIDAILYEEDKIPRAGVTVLNSYGAENDDYKIEIESRSSESGPSGGMMMSLMIYNALTHQDLTNGKKVVGTGTIDIDGKVGKIGGVKYKIMGAVKDKADVFLVPADNYDEAMKVKKDKKYDIEIVKVETLQDAIDYLEAK